MKKCFCLLLVCAMALCLFGGTAGALPNPVADSSFTEILNTLGFALVAPGAAENCAWSVIDHKLAQVRFTVYDVGYTLRAQSGAEEDISGMYFTSDAQTPVAIVWCEGLYQAEESVSARVKWYDATNGVNWSLSCEDAAIDMEILAGYARDAFLYATKGALISVEGNPTTGYEWAAMNYDLETISVAQPVYEQAAAQAETTGAGGAFHFAVAGLQPGGESGLTLTYYRSWEGLGFAIESREYTVRVDGDYNVTLEEESVG